MLRLIRRHLKTCRFTSSRYRRCSCPIHVYGTLGGEKIRKALDLTSWEAATELTNAWPVSGQIGVVRTEVPEVKEAVGNFFEDAEARQLRASTITKQKNLLDKRLLPWCELRGIRQLRQLDVDALRQFRATWLDAPISAHKNFEPRVPIPVRGQRRVKPPLTSVFEPGRLPKHEKRRKP